MPQDKNSSTVDFLNDIDSADVFDEKKEESEDTTDVKKEDEKPLPFHQDPKVQRFIDKQVEKRLKDFKPTAEQTFRREVSEDINLPNSFIKLVGNDTEEKKQVLKDLSDYFGTLKGEARKEFLAEMQEQQREAEAKDTAAVEELNEAFESIEENYDVDLSSNSASAKQLRAQFIDYVRKIAPKDASGEVVGFPDMDSAFETFQERNKRAPASRAKELASRGMTRSNETSNASEGFKSSNGDPWKQVERHFNKLKGN